MRTILLALIAATCAMAQSADAESNLPVATVFVAPAYPRAAIYSRLQGKARALITVNVHGTVAEVRLDLAHPAFAAELSRALKQWRFRPSARDYTFEVVCVFDLSSSCEGPHPQATSPETHVSAELPTYVHVHADWCQVDRD